MPHIKKSKSDSAKSATNNYALKEIALESLVQMWRIPNIVQELYLNVRDYCLFLITCAISCKKRILVRLWNLLQQFI